MAFAPRDADGFELLATPREVRAMDRAAIDDWGLPGRLLMELAGAGAAQAIMDRTGGIPGKAVILCGPGNNGGDGYVVARHLSDHGWTVRVVALGTVGAPADPASDAAVNHALWLRMNGELRIAERGATARMRNWLGHANAIVDALFGTGLKRGLDGAAAELVLAANEATHGLKVALDLPSGLDGDRGTALGPAFRADLTTTFGVAKTGLYLGDGPQHAGEIVPIAIGWPRAVIDHVGATARIARPEPIGRRLPARPSDGHKGSFGHVAIVGGFDGKDGAAVLAGLAVLRSGAGLATWCRPGPPAERPPELMYESLDNGLTDRARVIVVGPGLGTSPVARVALAQALAANKPLVLDADALNLIAEGAAPLAEASGHIITPHPLEAARLLGTDAETIAADRFGAAQRLVAKTGAVVVLKGARTIVASPPAGTQFSPPVLFDCAEPALATGGSGDVLAGVIAGLLAQGAPPRDAALVGVWLHAAAGRAAGMGRAQRGVLAHELADAIPTAIEALLRGWC